MIISMYAKGMTTRQISETIEDIYGFETSEGFISDVTDKILPQIEDWQNRPLNEVYPILFIDAIHYSVRDNGVIRKLAAYVILGINTEGKKEVHTIQVCDNESSKYWLAVLNELKNRGVKDILILCADGLSGIKEAITAAFPKTEYQRCIVHQVRNTLKYVPDKDRKAFATDLKTIYQAPDEKKALAALDRVTEKWTPKYPNSMKRWKDNWDAISPIFKFSATVRKVIYTTNAISDISFNGRVQYSSSLLLVVNKIWQRYFNTTDRKLSCVAVTLKLSMINRVSDFRERRKRLCLWKRSCSLISGGSSIKSMSVIS